MTASDSVQQASPPTWTSPPRRNDPGHTARRVGLPASSAVLLIRGSQWDGVEAPADLITITGMERLAILRADGTGPEARVQLWLTDHNGGYFFHYDRSTDERGDGGFQEITLHCEAER